MTFLSVSFLVLEILILVFAGLIGYRRGVGRTAVRLVYLILIGIGAFWAARAIAASVSASVLLGIHELLPADILSIFHYSPELEPLIINIVGAMLAPVLFAALFGLLQLVTLIFFKKISTAIVAAISDKDTPTWSRWVGAVSGLVIGLAISAVLLSPLYLVLSVVDHTPDRTTDILTEAYDQNVVAEVSDIKTSNALSAQPTPLSAEIKPGFNAARLFPWNAPLVDLLTKYNIHEQSESGAQETLTHSLPLIFEMAGDALRSYNSTIEYEGGTYDALTNAASTVIPYIDQSETVKYLATDVIHALGMTFQDGNTFFGLKPIETNDPFSQSILSHLIDALAHTTSETVKDNMVTLFGSPTFDQEADTISTTVNSGLLVAMIRFNPNDPLSSLASGDTTALVGSIAENGGMDAMLKDIHEYATDLIEESGIDLADRQYEEFYTDVKDEISDHIVTGTNSEDASITDIAKDIEGTIGNYVEDHDIALDDIQVSVVSVSIAKEFTNEKYINENGELDISIKDLMSFFGIDESQIPDWAH